MCIRGSLVSLLEHGINDFLSYIALIETIVAELLE